MKAVILVCWFTCAACFYTDIDEKLNLEKVLSNRNELHKYIDCFLDKAPCTETMNSYKKHFKEATENACADCTAHQKHTVEQFIKVAALRYPQELFQLEKKLDPEGNRMAKVLAELAKY